LPVYVDYLIWSIPYALICYALGMWGGNKEIGFGKAILISFFLTPVVGLIVIMNSKKRAPDKEEWKREQIPDGYPEQVRIEYSRLLAAYHEGDITKEEFEERKGKLLDLD
jgi:hypothetical protein